MTIAALATDTAGPAARKAAHQVYATRVAAAETPQSARRDTFPTGNPELVLHPVSVGLVDGAALAVTQLVAGLLHGVLLPKLSPAPK